MPIFGTSRYPLLDRLNRLFTLFVLLGLIAVVTGVALVATSFWSSVGAAGSALIGAGVPLVYGGLRARRS
ncbi:MAG: hypothetical protein NVSMB48_22250 [Marmoricola sp.]